MTVIEALKAARSLITDPEKWTTIVYARDAQNESVSAVCPTACKWCAVGAICKVCSGKPSLLSVTSKLLNTEATLVVVNDFQGHAAVLELFDRTIKTLEKESNSE